MKKRMVEIVTAVLAAVLLNGCATTGSQAELMTDDGILEGQEEYNAALSSTPEAEKALSVSNELKAAVCAALINQFDEEYSKDGFIIPAFHILDVNEDSSEDILVWGDFWLYAYRLEDDTLISVVGEDVSGCMHLRQQGGEYQCSQLEVAAVGDSKEKTEQDIFGVSYQSFQDWRGNYEDQETTRAQLIADYASAFEIPAVNYSDQGWRSAQLPDPSPDSDNVFLYMRRAIGTEDEQDASQAEPATATPEKAPASETDNTYIVVKGDMLERIAKRYGLTTLELAEPNRDTIFEYAHRYGVRVHTLLRCSDFIYPGEVLIIPTEEEVASNVVQGKG